VGNGGDEEKENSSEGGDEGGDDPAPDEGYDNSGDDDPPPVEEKRGCGCRVPGAPSPSDTGLAAVLGLAGLLLFRRRST
jgi:MYXO-CTERM domain-containing protein